MPSLLRLSWYGYKPSGLPAHRLQLDVVLKRPHGSLNPAGFRYESWLFRAGYRATGSIKAGQYDPNVSCRWHCQYQRLHIGLVDWVRQRFSEAEQFPLIASLLVGYRGHLNTQAWDTLKATGTVHLVAISGLHLGLVALGAGWLSRWLLLLLPGSCFSETQRHRTVYATVVLCCVLYALAAGFTVPTRRALIMVIVGGWAILCARQTSVWGALIIALGLVLFSDPFAPLDQGFWLSFGAVAVLVGVFAGRLSSSGWFYSLLIAQFAIFAGLWPVLGAFGQQQPVAGAVANLIAIPWVSLVVMPVLVSGGLLTAAFPSMAGLIGQLFDIVLGALWYVLSWLADCPFPEVLPSTAEIVGLAVLVMCAILMPFGSFRLVVLPVIALWAGLEVTQNRPPNTPVTSPKISVLDVGQGLSVLIQDGAHVLLYDTGPEVKGVFSAVDSVLLPNLRAAGIQKIDTLVISHADSDHSGGLALLVKALEVVRIVTGEPEKIREKLHGIISPPVSPCQNGSESLGSLSVNYWKAPGVTSGNDASCVVGVVHGVSGIEWILPGDLTKKREHLFLDDLAKRAPQVLPNTRVVIAPHHGSKTSSSAPWVDALRPDIVIYSAGYRHRYGHPHRDVTARYRQVGTRQLNTACSGLLDMTIDGNGLVVREMRQASPFWISGKGLARSECQIP